MAPAQSRYWMFTMFKPPGFFNPQGHSYVVYQQEECPTTRALHLQGYIEFPTRKRITAVKEALGDPTAHVEPRRGTQEEAIKYCTKEDTRVAGPWTDGQPTESHQGQRSDLEECAALIQAGKRERDIADVLPTVLMKYPRGVQTMIAVLSAPRTPSVTPCVIWIHGPSGSGKSRWAYGTYPPPTAYWKPDSSKWWPNYAGQSTVVLDDFDDSAMPLKYWLRIMDRYPMQVEPKGGYVELIATKFIITHTKHPQLIWPNPYDSGEAEFKQIHRRITKIIHVDNLPSEDQENTPDVVPQCSDQ